MIKRMLVGVIVIFLVLGAEDWQNSSSVGVFGVTSKTPTAKITTTTETPSMPIVTRIVDGDTIVVLMNDTSEKVRLIGVNTPESVDPRKEVQCFGKEASEFTRLLLLNKTVHLESDDTQGDRDRYGRLLRYVFFEDGTLVNEKIITEGYGHEYTYRLPYKYQTDFKNAEHLAREAKKGLWGEGICGY